MVEQQDATVTITNTSDAYSSLEVYYVPDVEESHGDKITTIYGTTPQTIKVPVGSTITLYPPTPVIPRWTATEISGDITEIYYGYNSTGLAYTINGNGSITGYAWDTD